MSLKACPKCGSTRVRRFSSLRYCQCDECLESWPWDLKEGQTPLVGPSRKMEKANERPR